MAHGVVQHLCLLYALRCLLSLHLCDAPFTHALGSKPVDNKRSGVRKAAGECLLGNMEPLAEARICRGRERGKGIGRKINLPRLRFFMFHVFISDPLVPLRTCQESPQRVPALPAVLLLSLSGIDLQQLRNGTWCATAFGKSRRVGSCIFCVWMTAFCLRQPTYENGRQEAFPLLGRAFLQKRSVGYALTPCYL